MKMNKKHVFRKQIIQNPSIFEENVDVILKGPGRNEFSPIN